MTSKNFRAATISAAIGVVIACVIAVIVAAMLRPAPQAQPEIPAPLPPGTGVDGGGEGIEVVEPDAGAGADVTVEPGPSDGVGGEVYVDSPAYAGKQRLNAGYYYPSGSFHGAWDIGLWTGTKLYAAFTGRVVGANDGVKNNPPGWNPGGGAPSNWILLCRVMPKGTPYAGQPVVLYYQHLSPGLRVKAGQNVKLGQWIGLSGNTGNSTGPHLHLSASTSPYGCGMSQSQANSIRYLYLQSGSARLFAPSKAWAQPPKLPTINLGPVRAAALTRGSTPGVRQVKRALGLPTAHTVYGEIVRRTYAKRFPATRGVPNCGTLTRLGQGRFAVRCG